MRIRTDGDYAYRRTAIERAEDFYDCNRTKAVVSACDDVPHFVRAARQVLARDDLMLEQRQKMAETLPTRVVNLNIGDQVIINTD
ncbi:hypothetical protein [Natrialba sp. PRR66]|uniref:DUF7692 domain-containing protein n=1 Tax=Natrialba sp. PRR66 TaxID=3098146 RepID=UPI002B1DEF04|nr:hypothetical protein [Natrialba sp. PRR66]